MTEQQYLKKLRKALEKADTEITKAVALTYDFQEENKEKYDLRGLLSYTTEDRLVDEVAMQAAKIKDILAGKTPYPCTDKSYDSSLTRKIRRALGYTI